MKRLLAGITTAVLVAGLLIAAAVRSASNGAAQTPEICLDQMFAAMKAGNVKRYLDCFTGELHDRLARETKEQTPARFAEYLQQQIAPLKGRAVLQREPIDGDHVRVVIDRVYESRPWEYQGYRLRRESGVWRIYAIDPAEFHEPPVPYGTPAFQELPPDEPGAKSDDERLERDRG